MTSRWTLPIVAVLVFGMSFSAHAETIQISMENLVISPAEATAKVGDTIEWINKDIFVHTATARSGDWDVTTAQSAPLRVAIHLAQPRFERTSSLRWTLVPAPPI